MEGLTDFRWLNDLSAAALLLVAIILGLRELTRLVEIVRTRANGNGGDKAGSGKETSYFNPDHSEHRRQTEPVLSQLCQLTQAQTAVMKQIAQDIYDLHQWHNTKDSDGVFTWQIRESSRKAWENIAAKTEQNNKLLGVLVDRQDSATISQNAMLLKLDGMDAKLADLLTACNGNRKS